MPSKTTKRPARRQPSAPRRRYLPPGQHIAPFLSPRGTLVMLAIGYSRQFISSYDVDGPDMSQAADGQVDERSPLNAWDDGVHVAPWRDDDDLAATVLIGLSESRLLCQMTVHDPADVAVSAADLAVQLDIIANSDPSSRLHDEDDEADADGNPDD